MRIIAGRWRGRRLTAPQGLATRPTADRARQAIFDQLWHAPWAGREALDGAFVLDAFAGTGAMGLEALSRGAARAVFMEQDPAALKALRANIASCKAEPTCQVMAGDVTAPPAASQAAGLIFLDPPYGKGLLPRALIALQRRGWIAPDTLIVAEAARDEAWEVPEGFSPITQRDHGAAHITILRHATTMPDCGAAAS